MVQGIEDLRTPLREIIRLDMEIRGTLSGFMMPAFVVDLPGGGGKRLVSTHDSYENGVATYSAPGLKGGKEGRSYTYYDPKPIVSAELEALREHQAQALKKDQTLDQVLYPRTPATMPAEPRAPAQKPTPTQEPVRNNRYRDFAAQDRSFDSDSPRPAQVASY